mgnify:CR=1 FL=1
MQTLNFIPSDYIEKKLARKANFLCAILVAAVGLAMAMLLVVLSLAEDSLQDEETAIQGKVTEASAQVETWKKFQTDRVALLDRAGKAAKLLAPLPRSRIVAEVVRALPKQTTLLELSVAEETVTVIEAAKPEAAKKPGEKDKAPPKPAAARGSKRGALAEKQQDVTKLRMVGLAPRDIEVAELIASLSNSPYFDQVELPVSEDFTVGNRVLRKFEVLFVLSGDAYRLALNGSAKEGRL